jgi:hypothetical protein
VDVAELECPGIAARILERAFIGAGSRIDRWFPAIKRFV